MGIDVNSERADRIFMTLEGHKFYSVGLSVMNPYIYI